MKRELKIGKKEIWIFFTTAIAIVLISTILILCLNADAISTPRKTLKQYIEALKAQDIVGVAACVFSHNGADINILTSTTYFSENQNENLCKYDWAEYEVRWKTESAANVKLRIKIPESSPDKKEGDNYEFYFICNNGKWLLSSDVRNHRTWEVSQDGTYNTSDIVFSNVDSSQDSNNNGGSSLPYFNNDGLLTNVNNPNSDNPYRADTTATKIAIPDTYSVNNQTFIGCTQLREITLPSNLVCISYDWFKDCRSLEKVFISEQNNYFSSSPDKTSAFYTDGILFNKTKTVLMYYPKGKLVNAGFNEDGCYAIPSTVKTIAPYAFSGSSISTLTIPSSVKTVGQYAFKDCESLKLPLLPEGLETISKGAFRGCINFIEIMFPSTLTTLAEDAFKDCISLETIQFRTGSKLKVVGDGAFDGCKKMVIAELPNGLTEIGSWAFQYTALTVISLPSSLEKIGMFAFRYSINLEYVYIPISVKTIGRGAFAACVRNDGKIGVIDCAAPARPNGWSVNFADSSVIINWGK